MQQRSRGFGRWVARRGRTVLSESWWRLAGDYGCRVSWETDGVPVAVGEVTWGHAGPQNCPFVGRCYVHNLGGSSQEETSLINQKTSRTDNQYDQMMPPIDKHCWRLIG